jgi:hypothetical protein
MFSGIVTADLASHQLPYSYSISFRAQPRNFIEHVDHTGADTQFRPPQTGRAANPATSPSYSTNGAMRAATNFTLAQIDHNKPRRRNRATKREHRATRL